MSLKDTLSTYWVRIQEELLPWLGDTTCGPLSGHHKQLVSILGMVRIEAFLPSWQGLPGRPPSERAALARAFVAKAVFNFPTTSLLIEMLSADKTLRRLSIGSPMLPAADGDQAACSAARRRSGSARPQPGVEWNGVHRSHPAPSRLPFGRACRSERRPG